MRLVVTSDTHGKHRDVKIPDGDIFVHAGDFTIDGELPVIEDFNNWLGELPHKYKFVQAGNHDRVFELYPDVAEQMISNARYMRDEEAEVGGLAFYFSPWTPRFNSYYWKFHKDKLDMWQVWDKIPKHTQILITHGPPEGVRDLTLEGDRAGDRFLLEAVRRVKPNLHFFGHIHEAYGCQVEGETVCYNVSAVDRAYKVRNAPIVMELE